MASIGVMQGRLLPKCEGRFQCFPRERWREEFGLAAEAGLDAIEWIYGEYGAEVNPLATSEGIAEMRELAGLHGVKVASLDADYFKDLCFSTASPAAFDELTEKLRWLIGQCRQAGISRIVMPLLDTSRIENAEQEDRIAGMLMSVAPHAADNGVELDLETDLSPESFRSLLAKAPHSAVKVNYDSGNSASHGYDVHEELAAYGDRIGGVHIKDRVRGGSTVPLGTGSATIPALLSRLAELQYAGDYIMEAARGPEGDELPWVRKHRIWLVAELERAHSKAARGEG